MRFCYLLGSLLLGFSSAAITPKTLLDITRFRANVVPTSLLTIMAAPRVQDLNPVGFGKAFTMVHLLSSASMVINDIYDQSGDRVNHPDRPLVSGKISEKEAWITVGVLSTVYGVLGLALPRVAAPYWIGAWVLIMAYTPVLKNICFVKNLACAATIGAAVPFIGLSATSPNVISRSGLWGRARFVFAGSLYCEVLMDILDKGGDAMAGIRTLPVLHGNPATLGILTVVLALLQASLYRTPVLMVLMFPLYRDLWRIHRGGYCPHGIKRACKQTTGLLLLGIFVGNLRLLCPL
jgi:4-hydroxybenzoate polyprenyltransferase